jgi:hypothetical protein
MLTVSLYAFALLVPGLLMWSAHPLIALGWLAFLAYSVFKPGAFPKP